MYHVAVVTLPSSSYKFSLNCNALFPSAIKIISDIYFHF